MESTVWMQSLSGQLSPVLKTDFILEMTSASMLSLTKISLQGDDMWTHSTESLSLWLECKLINILRLQKQFLDSLKWNWPFEAHLTAAALQILSGLSSLLYLFRDESQWQGIKLSHANRRLSYIFYHDVSCRWKSLVQSQLPKHMVLPWDHRAA